MKSDVFDSIMSPLTRPEFKHIKNIRIGTKALTYHPYRFLTDPDADATLECFRSFIDQGKHISIMAHFSHYNEISKATIEAVKRLREVGCNVRTQAPIMRYINDNPLVWAKMWEKQVEVGMIPYYMFIARDTGPQAYLRYHLQKLYIFIKKLVKLSGLSHTARGPSMSCGPGKICVIGREKLQVDVFVLIFTR